MFTFVIMGNRRWKRRRDGRSNSPTSNVYIFRLRLRILSSHSQHNHYMFVYQQSNIQSFLTTMDGDQEDRKPLNKGKGKERAQSLPETAGEASTTPPTLRSNSSPEGNQAIILQRPPAFDSAGPPLLKSEKNSKVVAAEALHLAMIPGLMKEYLDV
jgi:hypothetical protein